MDRILKRIRATVDGASRLLSGAAKYEGETDAMLFHCHMEVQMPPDMPAAELEDLKKRERAYSQNLQQTGKWPELWRIAGRFANISILDCADADELHALLQGLPMFPYMDIEVTPLARHPNKV